MPNRSENLPTVSLIGEKLDTTNFDDAMLVINSKSLVAWTVTNKEAGQKEFLEKLAKEGDEVISIKNLPEDKKITLRNWLFSNNEKPYGEGSTQATELYFRLKNQTLGFSDYLQTYNTESHSLNPSHEDQKKILSNWVNIQGIDKEYIKNAIFLHEKLNIHFKEFTTEGLKKLTDQFCQELLEWDIIGDRLVKNIIIEIGLEKLADFTKKDREDIYKHATEILKLKKEDRIVFFNKFFTQTDNENLETKKKALYEKIKNIPEELVKKITLDQLEKLSKKQETNLFRYSQQASKLCKAGINPLDFEESVGENRLEELLQNSQEIIDLKNFATEFSINKLFSEIPDPKDRKTLYQALKDAAIASESKVWNDEVKERAFDEALNEARMVFGEIITQISKNCSLKDLSETITLNNKNFKTPQLRNPRTPISNPSQEEDRNATKEYILSAVPGQKPENSFPSRNATQNNNFCL
jgi:16S rRNA U1498 N3-methylase RsmE